jgi:hypothetical protein
VVRWRIIDLCQWVWDEYEISVSQQTLSRELRAMGYRRLSARPRHHAQAADAIEVLKKLAGDTSGNRAGTWPRSRRHRGLVRGRSEDWAEEQDHPTMGAARQPPIGAVGVRGVAPGSEVREQPYHPNGPAGAIPNTA